MLAELAAANAAFAVIKQAVSNGKEIAAAGNAIAQFVGAKENLERKAQQKGGGSDLEEFLALEKIKEQEKQLKELMIYTGRPGLWNDWQRFQAKARVARREAEAAASVRRKNNRSYNHHSFYFGCCAAYWLLLCVDSASPWAYMNVRLGFCICAVGYTDGNRLGSYLGDCCIAFQLQRRAFN